MFRLIVLLCFFPILCHSQGGWEWEVLPSMPEPVSNNAVVEAFSGDSLCVYSFTGISAGLEPSDIHLKSWRFNTVNEEWTRLPDVDDFRGKIAAGASTVGNIIYLIGGYYVFDNFSEQSSEKVHRFDADANVWLEDGADIPVPIDDHVQAVWRDSLIYVITGWSQNTNVNAVQIYDPSADSWTAGTSTPNSNNFEVFGASGAIIGDTIYYYGGTKISGFNFLATNEFRKGVINPENPTEIEWSLLPPDDLPEGYRMASCFFENELIWIGGSEVAYNFDGLAYSGGSVVQPHQEIRTFNTEIGEWSIFENSPFAVMDLRGIARLAEDEWIIAGGMTTNAAVSDAVYKIKRGPVSAFESNAIEVEVFCFNDLVHVGALPSGEYRLDIIDLTGRTLKSQILADGPHRISTAAMPDGIYLLSITHSKGSIYGFANFKIATF